ncbi:MAG: hypothetical protein VYE22_28320 [Myxococcota bacterium]|nr:hypothetical protein [Myxococcota bacterium]
MSDDLLERACAALAEETTPPADDASLARVLSSLEARRSRRAHRRTWLAAAAAALLAVAAAPTAWAWTGDWVRALLDPAPAAPSPEPAPSTARSTRPAPPPSIAPSRLDESHLAAEAPEDQRGDPPTAGEPPPPRPVSAPLRLCERRIALEAPEEENEPSVEGPGEAARIERARYQRAYQAHFAGAPQGEVLAAWDDYLRAYPTGRYAREARWHRALTHIRLGRLEEAREGLRASARRGHRAEEARALLDAMPEATP